MASLLGKSLGLPGLFLILALLRLHVSADELIKRAELHDLHARTPGSSWWFANIKRQGSVPYGNSSWVLYRNVQDFGAVGDGVANDTQALLDAFFLGPRCVGQFAETNPCESSTVTPAIVYIPPGTYLIYAPIIMPYNSLVIGDALNMPTLKAHASFNGIGLLDPDPYYSGGASWYANQNNFYRQVRNLIFDITEMPIGFGHCIHWQVAQATSLQNLVFNMRVGGGSSNQQLGIFMDNGSGGFMRDLVFNGGGTGFFLGNQQFTSTNLTFNDCGRAIYMNWDWIWSFKQLTINNCDVGIDMTQNPSPSLGTAIVADTVFTNVSQAIITTFNCTNSFPPSAGTLIIDNVDFSGATKAISYPNGTVILPGGQYVEAWIQGMVYSAQYGQHTFPDQDNRTCYVPQVVGRCVQQSVNRPPIPMGLLNAEGGIFDKAKPNYDDLPVSFFISAKDSGCKGDGVSDDTACLQDLFNNVNSNQVAYIDHGAYIINNTILIPKNIRILGEGWPKIMIKSSTAWSDVDNPVPAFQVGNKGDVGTLEMQDIVFETIGPTPGAILMQWNLEATAQGTAGMWDVHWRIGGSAGTQLQVDTCQKNPSETILVPNPNCYASFLILHITETASLYMENNWGWVADHELDANPHDQINIWNGRGLLVESRKPVWIVGGSFEHSQLYNYQVANAKDLYMSHIQSETAYMQDNPVATLAFSPNPAWDDPDFSNCRDTKCIKTWGLRVYNSTYIFIYGAGLYSFFQNYDSSCLITHSCQDHIVSVELSEVVYIFTLYTIGSTDMVSMDGTALVAEGNNENTFGEGIAVFEYI